MNDLPTESTYTCPCCGGTLASPPSAEEVMALQFYAIEHNVPFSDIQKNIVNAMLRKYPTRISLETLVDYAYSDRIDGGPLFAKESVMVSISKLRKKLAPLGWTIKNDGGGRSSPGKYQLEPLKTH